ncbi:hypothetical protein [Reinekea blandensis]|nr:hypothetical protein [Reinekea blandensis]
MPHSMVWLSTDEIIGKVPCTCVDGRTSGLRYSAAGGSLGLLMSILNYAEKKRGRSLTDDEIHDAIHSLAITTSPMYLHTDQHTIELIYARMGLESDTRLRALTEQQQRSFTELAVRPDHQGCGHIKLMMQHPEKYNVSLRLAERVLRQHLKLFFARTENVLFDVLAGHHAEEQVFIIEEQSNIDPRDETVLVLENKTDGQQFFCHRPLKRELIRRYTEWLTEHQVYNFTDEDRTALALLHNQQAETTLGILAGDLSIEKIDL